VCLFVCLCMFQYMAMCLNPLSPRGFKWQGREVRIGDVVAIEAAHGDCEWIARVDSCWEERSNLRDPRQNRRLVSLTWYVRVCACA
jgi:hypothetical protein